MLEADVALEIRRNSVPLKRIRFPAADLTEGPLTFRIRKLRAELSVRVNSLAETKFIDPFPLLQEDFRYGLICSASVPLQRLAAANQQDAERPSPLEQADALVESGQFAAAEELYAAQVAQGPSSPYYDEAAYKQATCLVSQDRPDDALPLFDAVMRRSDPQWALLSGCQVWVLQLKAGQPKPGNQAFDYLQSRFDPQEFARLVPSEVRGQILKLAWRAEVVSDARLAQGRRRRRARGEGVSRSEAGRARGSPQRGGRILDGAGPTSSIARPTISSEPCSPIESTGSTMRRI